LEAHQSEEKKEDNLNDYFQEKDNELKNMAPTTPNNVSYANVELESFELDVDLVNHLSVSGNLEKFEYRIIDKPVEMNNKKE